MSKRSLNQPVIIENHQSGCMWNLINSFDFLHGNSRKLLYIGNGHIWDRIGMLNSADKKCECIHDQVDTKTMKQDVGNCNEKKHKKLVTITEHDLRERHTSKGHKNTRKICDHSDPASVGKSLNKLDPFAITDVLHIRDGGGHQPKQFFKVLEILNSNKELFMKLLQDPNSLLTKHIQELREYQEKKDLARLLSKRKPLGHWFSMETPCNHPVFTQKGNICSHFFKKIKFPSKYLLKESENPRTLMEVPYPERVHNFENRAGHSSSSSSYKPQSLSFSKIKSTLKLAIGGKRKGNNYSYDCPSKLYGSASMKEMGRQNFIFSSDNIYVEARKHISEICDGIRGKDISKKRVSRTLEKILSSPEHYFSPIFSPEMGLNHDVFTAQMRFSPYINCYMSNETNLKIQEKKNSCPSRVRQNPDSPGSADNKPDGQSYITDLKLSTMEDVYVDSSPTGSVPLVQDNVLVLSSKSTLIQTLSASQSTDRGHICAENDVSEGSRLDLPSENQNCTSSSVASSSSSLNAHGMQAFDEIKDIVVDQSPITAHVALIVESITSPIDTTFQPDSKINASTEAEIQPFTSDHLKAVLKDSSLNWEELIAKNYPLQQIFNLENRKLHPIQSCVEDKLLFDCINEVFLDLYQQYFGTTSWFTFSKPKMNPVWVKNIIVRELINGVNRYLVLPKKTCPLEQHTVKDMEKMGSWVDLRVDVEDIVIEMVEIILEELTEETIAK